MDQKEPNTNKRKKTKVTRTRTAKKTRMPAMARRARSQKERRRGARRRRTLVMESRSPSPLICSTQTTEDQSLRQNIPVSIINSHKFVLELSLTDISKLIGDEWTKLSPDQKNVSDKYSNIYSLPYLFMPFHHIIHF